MRVFITGGNGFIGQRVTRRLLEAGAQVRWASRTRPATLPEGVEHVSMDLSAPQGLGAALEGCSHVIHLAAREDFPLLPKGDPDGDLMFRTNVLGTEALLKACRGLGIEKIVVVTAIWSFGWNRDGTPNDGSEPRNIGAFHSAYALSRYQTEFVCLEHAARGLPVCIAAPSVVVGAGDTKVAGPAVTWTGRGVVRVVPGGGMNCIDVEDVAQGLVNALHLGVPGTRYLFVNENITWQAFFTHIAAELGRRPPIRLPDAVFRVAQWFMMLRALFTGRKRAFGIGPEVLTGQFYFDARRSVEEIQLPQTPIAESLRQTVAWIQTGQLPTPPAALPAPTPRAPTEGE